MAITPAEQHQEDQASLTLVLMALLARLWPSFDPEDVPGSLPSFRDLAGALVTTYGRASAALAADFYRAERVKVVSGRVTVRNVPDVPEGFIDAAIVEALTAPPELQRDVLDSMAEQLVLDRGREQLLLAVRSDREAKGWARVIHEGACSFCQMLALRAGAGYLYRSKESANFRAHHVQPNGSGGDCRCSVEPVFTLPYEPTARARGAQQLWESVEKDENNNRRFGHDLRTAFRQAVEGRTVTGSETTKTRKRGEKSTRRKDPAVTAENQRHQLELLQALPAPSTPESAKWRAGRIAEIRKFLGE